MNWTNIGIGLGIVIGILGLSYGGFRVALYQHNLNKLQQMGKNQAKFTQLIERIHKETPYFVFITSGYRSTAKQTVLYQQNSKNAKPGTSPHEFKRALDFNLIGIEGWIRKRDAVETWRATGVPDIAQEMGFRWGGNFKNYHDPVHFDVKEKG